MLRHPNPLTHNPGYPRTFTVGHHGLVRNGKLQREDGSQIDWPQPTSGDTILAQAPGAEDYQILAGQRDIASKSLGFRSWLYQAPDGSVWQGRLVDFTGTLEFRFSLFGVFGTAPEGVPEPVEVGVAKPEGFYDGGPEITDATVRGDRIILSYGAGQYELAGTTYRGWILVTFAGTPGDADAPLTGESSYLADFNDARPGPLGQPYDPQFNVDYKRYDVPFPYDAPLIGPFFYELPNLVDSIPYPYQAGENNGGDPLGAAVTTWSTGHSGAEEIIIAFVFDSAGQVKRWTQFAQFSWTSMRPLPSVPEDKRSFNISSVNETGSGSGSYELRLDGEPVLQVHYNYQISAFWHVATLIGTEGSRTDTWDFTFTGDFPYSSFLVCEQALNPITSGSSDADDYFPFRSYGSTGLDALRITNEFGPFDPPEAGFSLGCNRDIGFLCVRYSNKLYGIVSREIDALASPSLQALRYIGASDGETTDRTVKTRTEAMPRFGTIHPLSKAILFAEDDPVCWV